MGSCYAGVWCAGSFETLMEVKPIFYFKFGSFVFAACFENLKLVFHLYNSVRLMHKYGVS